MTEQEIDDVVAVLGGAVLIRCVACNEALPFRDQTSATPDELWATQPRWKYVHEPYDGFPNCLPRWSRHKDAAQDAWHNRGEENGFMRPTEEQLARARAIRWPVGRGTPKSRPSLAAPEVSARPKTAKLSSTDRHAKASKRPSSR